MHVTRTAGLDADVIGTAGTNTDVIRATGANTEVDVVGTARANDDTAVIGKTSLDVGKTLHSVTDVI